MMVIVKNYQTSDRKFYILAEEKIMAIQAPPDAPVQSVDLDPLADLDPLDFLGDVPPISASEPFTEPFQDPGQEYRQQPEPPEYISPILDGMTPEEAVNLPPDSAACKRCPAAVWMLSGLTLTSYCRVLHLVTWSLDERTAPTRCDGQIASLAELPRQAPGNNT